MPLDGMRKDTEGACKNNGSIRDCTEMQQFSRFVRVRTSLEIRDIGRILPFYGIIYYADLMVRPH